MTEGGRSGEERTLLLISFSSPPAPLSFLFTMLHAATRGGLSASTTTTTLRSVRRRCVARRVGVVAPRALAVGDKVKKKRREKFSRARGPPRLYPLSSFFGHAPRGPSEATPHTLAPAPPFSGQPRDRPRWLGGGQTG